MKIHKIESGNYNRIGNRSRENMSKKSKHEEQNNIDNQDSINAEIPIGQGVDLSNLSASLDQTIRRIILLTKASGNVVFVLISVSPVVLYISFNAL